MHRKNGFTLTEILIVVAILGILASLAVPRLFPQTERGRSAEAISFLSVIRQGEEAYRLGTGDYLALTAASTNADWNQIGMELPVAAADNGPFFNYTVTIGAGPIFTATATRDANADPGGANYGGGTITLDQTGGWGGTHPFAPD